MSEHCTWFLIALHECKACGHKHVAMWREPDPEIIEADKPSDCSICGTRSVPVAIDPETLGAMMGNSTYEDAES